MRLSMDMYVSAVLTSYLKHDYDRGDQINRLTKTVVVSHAHIDPKNENLGRFTCFTITAITLRTGWPISVSV